MKSRSLVFVLLSLLWAAAGSRAEERPVLRYLEPSGPLSLTLTQEIGVPDHPGIAGRTLSFDLAIDRDPERDVDGLVATLERARGTYTAHGMDQRLSAGHLEGQGFSLSMGAGGRELAADEPAGPPRLAMGAPVERALPLAETLSEVLPRLPAEGVGVGSEWTTERELHSLEGWSWGSGRLRSTHRVTAIEREAGRTMVSVSSRGEADLLPIEGEAGGYRGKLSRSASWTFDASAGRLLSLAIEQETEGISPMPRGEVAVSQTTHIELTPGPRP
jgi:hypothetical protein